MSEPVQNGGPGGKSAGDRRSPFPWVEVAVIGGLAVVASVVWLMFFRERRPPNVVLISIDTLRSDHLGCYGYAPPTSPRLDALARDGARFERVHSTTSWTLPAHMALLTGQPNEVHGVIHDRLAVDPNVRLLAEAFLQHGYRTGGFYGGPYLEPFFGFGRGFEQYVNCGVDMFAAAQQTPAALQEKMLRAKEIESHRVVTAPKTTAGAMEFVEKHRDEPFFLFVHHWDVHYDFNAKPEFVKRFWPDAPPVGFEKVNFPFNERISADMTPDDRRWLIANFDAEIAWVDFHIGELLDKLDELGLADDTYVVVTSDHGEEFFEHGEKGHRKNLYDTTLRIPLLIAGPGIRKGVVVDEQARIFDVMPTILELCGLPADSTVFGKSLVPLLEGDAPPELRDLPIVAELTDVPLIAGEDGRAVAADYKNVHHACGGNGLKYLRAERRTHDATEPKLDPESGELILREEKLYDLGADPGERTDVSSTDPSALDGLRRRFDKVRRLLDAWRKNLGASNAAHAMPEELQRILDQIGYLQPGVDPKDQHGDPEDEDGN